MPDYDRTRLRPGIVHVGVGGFHRAHLALYTHRVAAAGGDWGIVGLGLTPQDASMRDVLERQDNLYTLVERGPGEPAVEVIGSIIGYVHAPPGRDDPVTELVAAPSTAILSLTITEAGYGEPVDGRPTAFDRIAAALAVRRAREAGPLTILSCDNLPGNGAVARRAALAAAERVGGGLSPWIQEHCTFPNSMVDRITPMTSDADRAWLRDIRGIDDGWPVVAEAFRQWVVEDAFAAGRPSWEDDGALFTDRVHDWELYKLRMLNAGHSSMAYLCALEGIVYVDEAMATPPVRTFVEDLLLREAVPTLAEIPGHPREEYVASVLERFQNTGVRDQIARLCIDGSAKFPTFLLPTIAAQLERGGPIDRGATALAGWARYLGVVEASEQSFDASGDLARRYGAAALADPVAFLDYAEVFGPELRDAPRFRAAFSTAYERVAQHGPLAAIAAAGGRLGAGKA
ncbi:mannitol dehydrogenase family protein [Baekduia sp.]|uniref:mannitol dehydrogenase family protein n=1 Tax=Baekduia sp. TaxID=2600305 RepID=UPI002D1FBB27|nr:mannitol dehydrogenase family protein [Baekduia sp.]